MGGRSCGLTKVGDGRGRALTDSDQAIGDFDWSPDGARLVFEKDDAGRRKRDEDPWVITGTQIQRDGEGVSRWTYRVHLWLVSASGGAPKPLRSGPFDDQSPRFSPKGDWIAFVSNRNPDPDASDDSDICWSAQPGGAPRRLAANPGPDVAPVWSHSGDRVAFVGASHANDYYRTTHVLVAPRRRRRGLRPDGIVRQLGLHRRCRRRRERIERESRGSADDSALIVPSIGRGANWIGVLPSGGGEARELLGGARVHGLVRLSNTTGRLYFTPRRRRHCPSFGPPRPTARMRESSSVPTTGLPERCSPSRASS
jgi:dipeptidyl aminopeptidase/acylaminoacyl peptidase